MPLALGIGAEPRLVEGIAAGFAGRVVCRGHWPKNSLSFRQGIPVGVLKNPTQWNLSQPLSGPNAVESRILRALKGIREFFPTLKNTGIPLEIRYFTTRQWNFHQVFHLIFSSEAALSR